MGKQTSATTQVARSRTLADIQQAEAVIRTRLILAHEDDDHPADVLRDVGSELMELRALKAKVSMFVQQWTMDTARRM